MGNNLTALTQFYSPPNPPTPLSPDKYFWIESGGGGGADDDEERARPQCDGETAPTAATGETTTASTCPSPGLRTAIPVVYITRGGRDGGGSGPAGAGPAAGVDESQADGGRFTLLYCHGHDVDLGLIYDFLVHLSKLLGVDILSFDYAGYGLSKIGRRRRRRRGNGVKNSPPERGEAGQEVLLAASDARDPRRAEGGDPSGNDDDEGRRRRPEDGPEGEEEEEFSAADAAINASPPTEEQCYADVLACYEFLVREKNVPPKNIVLYGKSLGSGPACWLARRLCEEAAEGNGNGGGGGGAAAAVDGDREASAASIDAARRRKPSSSSRGFSPVPKAFRKSKTPPMPLGGVVLHSAFLSILRLRIHVGFTLSSTDAFDNDATLRGVLDCTTTENLPIYFIHGREDEVVPFQHGEALCEIMIGKRKKGFPPFWADGGTHWNIEHKYATAYIKRLQQFLRHCAKMNGVPVKKRNSKGKKGARDASRGRGAAATPSPNDAALEGAERERRAADPADPETGSRASSRGRGRISRPSFTMMSARARSNSKAARQRKKKGTLVMRGEVEEDGDGGGAAAAAGAPYGAPSAVGTSGGKKKKKGGHRRGGGGEGSSGKGTRGAKGGGGDRHGSLYASKLKAMVALESRDPPSMDRYI